MENPLMFRVGEDYSLMLFELEMGRLEEGYDGPTDDELVRFLINTHNYTADSIGPELINEYRSKLQSLNERNRNNQYIKNNLTIDIVRYFNDNDYK
jgi:hypothetical protein